jgi:hypothetical protein
LRLREADAPLRYGSAPGLHAQIARYKGFGRPVINAEWMARPQGSRWDTDLPLSRAEGVGCYAWGLVRRTRKAHGDTNGCSSAEP